MQVQIANKMGLQKKCKKMLILVCVGYSRKVGFALLFPVEIFKCTGPHHIKSFNLADLQFLLITPALNLSTKQKETNYNTVSDMNVAWETRKK
jgi:hypothetical protein